MRVEAEGYARSDATSEGARLVEVTAEGNNPSVAIRLWRASSIEGRILDPQDRPVPKAAVMVFRARYFLGRKVISSAGTATADAGGRYRVGRLARGRYFLAANADTPQAWRAGGQSYVPTLYPDVVEAGLAVAVDVPHEAAVAGFDVGIRVGTPFAVGGTIVDEQTGKPASGIRLTLTPGDWRQSFRKKAVSGEPSEENGRFRIAGLLPGKYRVSVLDHPEMRVLVDIIDLERAQELRVSLVQPRDIAGWLHDASGEALGGRRVALEPCEFLTYERTVMPSGVTDERGRFQIAGVHPRSYQIRILGLKDDEQLTAVRVGDEQLQSPLLAQSSVGAGLLELTVGKRSGVIDGTVKREDNNAAFASIAAVPDRDDGFRTPVRGIADAAGHFRLSVLPGVYRLVAVDTLPSGIEGVRSLRPLFESEGTKVEVDALQTGPVTVPLAGAEFAARILWLEGSLSDLY